MTMFSRHLRAPGDLALYGYRAWEVGLTVNTPPVDPSFVHKHLPVVYQYEPKIMAVSLGCHVEGASNLWTHTHDPDNAVLGVMKRIATKMPDCDQALFEKFFDFSVDMILTQLKTCVLRADSDLSVGTWLKKTNYPNYRKEELLEVSESHEKLTMKDRVVSSHIKHEPYVEPKYARGIYSRSDFFKTYFGPACGKVGRRFFKLKWFIKKYSAMGKLDRMRELFDNEFVKCFTNDFTAFESTMRRTFMAIEVFFFAHCFQNLSNFDDLVEEVMSFKMGTNTMKFNWFIVKLLAKRYSGEMDTSLCNGLINWLLMTFLLRESGHPPRFYLEDFPPQIEGDDSLGVYIHPLDTTILSRLGAKAKVMVFDKYYDASFCGMIFSDECDAIIRNPITCMLDFGYCHYKYRFSNSRSKSKLLKAKSLSLLCSYPGCPIVKELALYGLRVTASVGNRHSLAFVLKRTSDVYQRSLIGKLFGEDFERWAAQPVEMSTRCQMEKIFGISVDDQLLIEQVLKEKKDISPICSELLLSYCTDWQQRYFQDFSVTIPKIVLEEDTSNKFWSKLFNRY